MKNKPALTAEEWEKLEFVTASAYPVTIFVDGEADIGFIDQEAINGRHDGLGLLLTQDRPKLVALCLHGQPFGFTREDVELLRDASCCVQFSPWPE